MFIFTPFIAAQYIKSPSDYSTASLSVLLAPADESGHIDRQEKAIFRLLEILGVQHACIAEISTELADEFRQRFRLVFARASTAAQYIKSPVDYSTIVVRNYV